LLNYEEYFFPIMEESKDNLL